MQNHTDSGGLSPRARQGAAYEPRRLNDALRGQRFCRVLVVEAIDSTNTSLFELGRAGEPEGLVLLAEEQSAGRGRLGRSWSSPRGKSVLLSALARPSLKSEAVGLLNAAAGLAVVDAVLGECALEARLKWPNDIVYEGKKLGGILTESGSDLFSQVFYVIGIGLNVNWEHQDFPPEIADTATALSIAVCSNVARGDLVIAIARNLGARLSQLEVDPGGLRDRYARALSTLGQRVRAKLVSEDLEGTAVDIDERGDLIVALDSGERRVVVAGDVTEVRVT